MILFKEAHDLLNGWVADKIRMDIEDDIYNYLDVNEINTFNDNEKELTRLKSELLGREEDHERRTEIEFDILAIKGVDYDKYDEEYLTKDIMNRIMRKEVVDPKKLLSSDTSSNKKRFIDTKLKIELRHQVVKENREKRRQEMDERRREKLEKKEIELKAKQMVQKEEQDRKMREEIEKQLIEQEAQKLRFEMAEKRHRDEEIRKRMREMEQMRLEKERNDLSSIHKKIEMVQVENEIEMKKQEMAMKRAEDLADSYLKAKNLKV